MVNSNPETVSTDYDTSDRLYLEPLDLPDRAAPSRAWAKEAVFPADRFPGADERGPR